MNDSVLTAVLLPVALAIIMLGLGLTLTIADFTRVLRMPRAVLVALGTQVLLLPAICFGLVKAFELAPALAVGMMLLVASPGGRRTPQRAQPGHRLRSTEAGQAR